MAAVDKCVDDIQAATLCRRTVLEANAAYALQGVSIGRIQGGYQVSGRTLEKFLVFHPFEFDFADSVVDFCRRQVNHTTINAIRYANQIRSSLVRKKLQPIMSLQSYITDATPCRELS